MPAIGFLANAITIGAINQSWSSTLTHNFAPSNIWAHPSLQIVTVNSDEGSAKTFVSQFVDSDGVHNVAFIGLARLPGAKQVTSVTYRLDVTDCYARALCITEFWG